MIIIATTGIVSIFQHATLRGRCAIPFFSIYLTLASGLFKEASSSPGVLCGEKIALLLGQEQGYLVPSFRPGMRL